MSRLEWILGGILALLLAAAVFIGLIWWQGSKEGEGTPAINTAIADNPPTQTMAAPVRQTAQAAYAIAAERAREWADDSELTRGSASWFSAAELTNNQIGWSFIFYSDKKRETALITTIGQQAVLIGSRAETGMPPTVQFTNWQIDSDRAIVLILAAGGEDFINAHPLFSLNLRLETDSWANLAWTGILISQETGEVLTVSVDAASGRTIEQ